MYRGCVASHLVLGITKLAIFVHRSIPPVGDDKHADKPGVGTCIGSQSIISPVVLVASLTPMILWRSDRLQRFMRSWKIRSCSWAPAKRDNACETRPHSTLLGVISFLFMHFMHITLKKDKPWHMASCTASWRPNMPMLAHLGRFQVLNLDNSDHIQLTS